MWTRMIVKMVNFVPILLIVYLILHKSDIVYGQENSCELPKKKGTCNARIERWFFNINKGSCRKFIYSGCDGNPNNFESKNDCKKACNARVCRLPKNEGQCNDTRSKWFYDIDEMRCKQFTYTGCKGNKNRFSSKKKCLKRCGGVKKNACPPPTPCAAPRPDDCVTPRYIFVDGVRCASGCLYPPCKSGNCPPPLPPQKCVQCQYSRDCSGDLLCCSSCCRIPVLDPKGGSCPSIGLKRCIGPSSECSLDSQCTGKRKCCSIDNLKCCVDPENAN